jgi:alpha-L-fucosidase
MAGLLFALAAPPGVCDTAAREQTLRFPSEVAREDGYVEETPDPAYHHASAKAYERFRDLKYGVRIHWGLYSMLPDARESWTFLGMTNVQRQAYQQLYKTWDPRGFDAEAWMGFFERAGFRCFAITAKHHEGFSLWDTATRVRRRVNWTAPGGPAIEDCDLAYGVMDSPFRRDVIGELCDAARRHRIKIDLYFSHPDWYDADFRPFGFHPLQEQLTPEVREREKLGERTGVFPEPTPAERARMVARHREQLTELLTRYGKIDMLCLDFRLGPTVWPDLRETIRELRALQPDLMIRNRGIGNYGDYYTPERVVPEETSANAMPWMVIYPLGTNFSWERDGSKYKGAKWVVDNLVDSVAKGGNFMVGIGPDGSGRFHPTAIAQLEEVGAWLRANGECIFGTSARPGERWGQGESVRFTRSHDRRFLYAVLLSPPGTRVVLDDVSPQRGSRISLLGGPDALPWRINEGRLEIDFPPAAAASLAYALKVEAPGS